MRLFLRFDDGELDALRANGDGLSGGPPTTKPGSSEAASEPAGAPVRPALLDDRELR
jgi:hypothetical protein